MFLPEPSGKNPDGDTIGHHVAPDAVLCSDGDPAFSQFAVAHSGDALCPQCNQGAAHHWQCLSFPDGQLSS